MKTLEGMGRVKKNGIGRYKGPSPQKRPGNKSEAAFFDFAESQDWVITKKGWPDFFCFKPDGSVLLVEIKGARSRHLKAWQWKVMEALSKAGIACYKWTLNEGFTRVIPTERV